MIRRLVAPLALLAIAGGGLAAQQPDTSQSQRPDSSQLLRGMAAGVALDRFIADGGAGITAVSLRITGLNPGRVGVDFALGTYLPAIPQGVLLLGMDLGPAYNLAGPGGTGLLKAGGSVIMGLAAGGGGGAIFGGYVGGGVITRVGPRLGVRVDIAKRVYTASFEEATVSIWTLSFGVTSLEKRR